MTKALIASTSSLFGEDYLSYILPELAGFFQKQTTILFVPYAQPGGISYQQYTTIVATAFSKINKKVIGLHEFDDPITAIQTAEAVFVGGGNTFLLVATLYKLNLMAVLRTAVLQGVPYFGTSAGSNIAGQNMQTTNDMPIVAVPSYITMGLLPFNLNPHYLDPDLDSKHNGESRETRINEFHVHNHIPVLGLREGSWLEVYDQKIVLKGRFSARLFRQNQMPIEIKTEDNFDFLV